MLRPTLKAIAAHKRRLLSTAMAVLLGVAFLSGTLVVGDTMRASFTDTFKQANAGTDVLVRSATEVGEGEFSERGLLPQATVDEVLSVPGVAAVAPIVEGPGQIVGSDGDPLGGNGPPTFAAGWVEDRGINPWKVDEGRAPEADNEVVIDRAAATDGNLSVGDTVTVRTPAPVESTLVGIVTFGDADGLGGPTYAAFTTSFAQQVLLDEPGEVTGVLVAGDGSLSEGELAARVSDALPAGAEAITAAALTAEQEDAIEADFVGFVETALLMFAVIALVVATFSIYNTFSILVAQRAREMALLRAVGAARRQVLVAVVIEAVVVGLVGSLAGLVAGIGVAALLKALFAAVGGALPDGGTVVTAGTVLVGLLVGTLATLVAAVGPAIRASRVAPLAALREASVDRSATSRVRAVAGLAVLAAGVAAVLVGGLAGGDGSLAVTGVGAVAALVGLVVAGPVLARPAASVLGAPLARLRGSEGLLARRNAMRNPGRTSATASALLVGVGVVTVFTVFAASLAASLDATVDRTFGADLVVATSGFGGAGIDPELAGALADVPDVAGVVGVGAGGAVVDGGERAFAVAEPQALAAVVDLGRVDGSMALADDEVAVVDTTAEGEGWALGDTLAVTFADGVTDELTIGAVYEEADLVGGMVVPRAAYVPHATQVLDTAVYVQLAEGVSLDAGKQAIAPVIDSFGAPAAQDRDEFAASLTEGLDMLLTVVYALLALAIVIALMGIANTLALSTWERRRELGVLRAVGQTRAQLRRMVRWESVLIALFGTVAGLALGVLVGWGAVEAAGASSGAVSVFALPVGRLAVVLVVGAVAGVLAGARPARRAARLDPLTAIAAD